MGVLMLQLIVRYYRRYESKVSNWHACQPVHVAFRNSTMHGHVFAASREISIAVVHNACTQFADYTKGCRAIASLRGESGARGSSRF